MPQPPDRGLRCDRVYLRLNRKLPEPRARCTQCSCEARVSGLYEISVGFLFSLAAESQTTHFNESRGTQKIHPDETPPVRPRQNRTPGNGHNCANKTGRRPSCGFIFERPPRHFSSPPVDARRRKRGGFSAAGWFGPSADPKKHGTTSPQQPSAALGWSWPGSRGCSIHTPGRAER